MRSRRALRALEHRCRELRALEHRCREPQVRCSSSPAPQLRPCGVLPCSVSQLWARCAPLLQRGEALRSPCSSSSSSSPIILLLLRLLLFSFGRASLPRFNGAGCCVLVERAVHGLASTPASRQHRRPGPNRRRPNRQRPDRKRPARIRLLLLTLRLCCRRRNSGALCRGLWSTAAGALCRGLWSTAAGCCAPAGALCRGLWSTAAGCCAIWRAAGGS